MPKKKQPRGDYRELFTPGSGEEPVMFASSRQSGAEPNHINIHKARVNTAHTDMEHTDMEYTGLAPTDTPYTGGDHPNPAYPNKFLAQLIIVAGCLVITLAITHNRSGPSTWTRGRIHTAINASEQSTFGYLFNSKLFQTIVKNGKNLIRLEEVTQKIINPTHYSGVNSLSKNGIQPVRGQILRGFGPQVNSWDGRRQYSTGVEWQTLPGTQVLAIDDGIVTSVIPANSAAGEGGIITIDHGSGLSAIYYSLTGIRVNPGAHVKKGAIVGQTLSSEFFLEVKRNGLFIDPLRLSLN
ncbi:MAG: M23 family metallopeptidase [Firmicutes bacterium]|nr:M23 family metallopeptidase [Bacillota bacterium]